LTRNSLHDAAIVDDDGLTGLFVPIVPKTPELKNSLAKAVCFNRLGELRDRSFEAQRHRASGLNLVLAAIILWNTVYLERAIGALRQRRLENSGTVVFELIRHPTLFR